MVCDFKCKGLQQLSAKNAVWLVICVSTYAFMVILVIRHLTAFADSMVTVASVLGRQRQAKYMRQHNMKHVLLWKSRMTHIDRIKVCNSSGFKCLLTKDKALFGGDYSYFDAIVFDQSYLKRKGKVSIPRSSSQLYVFTSEESPSNYPACEVHNDEFFNWTFTYRLDSDIVWNYFIVRDIKGDIVAPSINVKWNVSKTPVSSTVQAVLRRKTKAAAWIVNDCYTMSFRDQHLMKLQEHLLEYNLYIDIYGNCTKRVCTENRDCEAMLRNNYYFYIAFENSLDDDYVTREVMHGYDNYAVPIVYGGADYSRFLPPGSYIDARQLHPHNLAELMHLTMNHSYVHKAFFYWTNQYTIVTKYTTSNDACDLCTAMHSEKAKNAPAKKTFRFWWNTPNGMKWCLPDAFWSDYTKKNLDSSHMYRNKY